MKLLVLTQKVDSTDDNLGFFHRWIEEFAKQCESVIVICLYEGKHDLPKNVRVLSLGKESGASRAKYLRRFYSYIWNERKNYDSVFVHMSQIYMILGGLLWRAMGKRIGLWYAHGTVSWTLLKATILSHVVFTSTSQGFRIHTSKKKIVGQGIDTELFSPRGDFVLHRLVTVGRISRSKNLHILIPEFAKVQKIFPDTSFMIVGAAVTDADRAYKKELESLINEHSIQGVLWQGPSLYTDLPPLFSSAHVFVNASATGSLDKVLLEALASDVPVISSNTAFGALVDGRNDLYAKSPDEIGEKVIDLFTSEVRPHLRDLVVQGHSLKNLISVITHSL